MRDARAYIELWSTHVNVGVYRPVGADSARAISACGRRVKVGFCCCWSGPGDAAVVGVIDDRKMGHSTIAFESVLRRMGR